MEPEALLPRLQEHSTGPYTEPDPCSPYPSTPLLWDPFKYYPSTYICVLLVAYFLLAFPPKSYMRATCPDHLILSEI
jgi:hypothetical protein